MALDRQVTFWVAALAVFVALLWLLSEILLPFVAGMALAYLLDPMARRAERLGINRAMSALIVIALFIVALVVAAMLIGPVLSHQFASFIDRLPGYLARLQELIADPGRPWLAKLVGGPLPDGGKAFGDIVSQGSGWVATFLKSLWSGGRAVFSVLSLLVITPVVAFYLLCDWDRLLATVDRWIPLPHRDTVRGLAREIDGAIAGFVRGQALICLILAAFYAIALTLVGLNFGFLIGLMTGFFGFIPYVGALTGFLVAGVVAVAQFWPSSTPILLVIGVFLVGQVLEGYVLSPKLVGAKVGLHPVWLIFSLIAFGYLFGFVGLLVAIPIAAAIGVLARFALGKYMASSFYTGQRPRSGSR
jgi:predicted PurR-regulated permease PerM